MLLAQGGGARYFSAGQNQEFLAAVPPKYEQTVLEMFHKVWTGYKGTVMFWEYRSVPSGNSGLKPADGTLAVLDMLSTCPVLAEVISGPPSA